MNSMEDTNDVEDRDLNRFLKAALESSAPFVLCPLQAKSANAVQQEASAKRRTPWRLTLVGATATLLAASVAVMAAFHLPSADEANAVVNVLQLLAEAEDVSLESSGASSPTDLLLAWQEAGPGN